MISGSAIHVTASPGHVTGSGGSHVTGSGGSHVTGSGGSHVTGSGGSHVTGSGGHMTSAAASSPILAAHIQQKTGLASVTTSPLVGSLPQKASPLPSIATVLNFTGPNARWVFLLHQIDWIS